MNDHRTEDLDALLRQVDGNPAAMVSLARLLGPKANRGVAVDLCTRALDLAVNNGPDGEVRAIATEVLSNGVPRWHFDIVRDEGRNSAYEAALRRKILPGSKVLEIGTGTGLLAMMAARAGAAEVITCEADPAIAMAARKVIELNGFSGRVRVITSHSTDLDVERDLHGPVDMLVSEILANDLLGEGTLPVLEHACRHLLKPGALIIPARGRVRVALAEDDDWDNMRMGTVAGFDLTPFNCLAAPSREIYIGASRLTLRSDPADLFSFDFSSGGPFPANRGETRLIATGRRVNGIAQWIALDMDGSGASYENRPEPGADSSWWSVFHPFERPLLASPGQEIVVHAKHDRGGLRVWV